MIDGENPYQSSDVPQGLTTDKQGSLPYVLLSVVTLVTAVLGSYCYVIAFSTPPEQASAPWAGFLGMPVLGLLVVSGIAALSAKTPLKATIGTYIAILLVALAGYIVFVPTCCCSVAAIGGMSGYGDPSEPILAFIGMSFATVVACGGVVGLHYIIASNKRSRTKRFPGLGK